MKKRFISLAAVCMLVPAILLARPAGKKQLVGVGAVKEAPVGLSHSPLSSLAMYGSDGSFTTCGGYKTFPPIPAVQEVANELGPGYGRWAATGDRALRLTFYSIMWKDGLANGYQRVQETLVMSESGDEYTGHAQVDFLDLNWNVVFSTFSDVKGTRLETPIPAMLVGQASEKNQLVGVWNFKGLTAGTRHILPGVDLFSADGSFINTNDRRTPNGTASPGRGRYIATGSNEFRLMFYAVELNKEGVVWGFLRVQSILALSESGDELTSRSIQWDLLDANWTVVFKGTGDTKAARLETPDED
jgi:hypothetical protein